MNLCKLTASQRKKAAGGKTDEKRMEQRVQKNDAVGGCKTDCSAKFYCGGNRKFAKGAKEYGRFGEK